MDFVQFPNQDSMFLSSLAIIMIAPNEGWSFSLSCIIINSINILLLVLLYHRLHRILKGHINCNIIVQGKIGNNYSSLQFNLCKRSNTSSSKFKY